MKDVELTTRETEIAELFAWGATKKDIANRLFISERTVENHARNIFFKTGVTKVNELSAWWFCTRFNISFDLSPLKKNITNAFYKLQTFATMDKFISLIDRAFCYMCAIGMMLLGFGNAIRCLFFLDYERTFDKVFYTVMLSLIGFVGLWMWNNRKNDDD